MDAELVVFALIFVVPLLLMVILSYQLFLHESVRPSHNGSQQPQPINEAATPATCPICLERLRHAAECAPCGHAFCAQCILHFWRSQGSPRHMLCPVDREPVLCLVPSFTVREVLGGSGGPESRGLDAELRQYHSAFPSGIHPMGMLRALWRRITLANFVRLRLSLFCVAVVLYIVSPFDLIPEAVFGLAGYLDDAFLVIIILHIVTRVWT